MDHRPIRTYNILLPIWLLVWFPSWLWLILVPANYLVDRLVLSWSLGDMEDKGTFCRENTWRVCVAGFISDFAGSALLLVTMVFLGSMPGANEFAAALTLVLLEDAHERDDEQHRIHADQRTRCPEAASGLLPRLHGAWPCEGQKTRQEHDGERRENDPHERLRFRSTVLLHDGVLSDRDGTLLVDGGDLAAAVGVALGRERVGGHPRLHDGHREHGADELAADAEHVGVVVLARELRAHGILAHAGEDATELVGDHRRAVPDAVDEDAALALALRDRHRGGIDEVGEVAALFIVGAEIDDLVALSLEPGLDLVLELRTCVVVRHGDLHGCLLTPCAAALPTAIIDTLKVALRSG